MAMQVKPIDPIAWSDKPDLTSFEKKPLMLQLVGEDNSEALARGVLTMAERVQLVKVLEKQLSPLYTLDTMPWQTVPTKAVAPVSVANSTLLYDECDAYDKWLASNTPLVIWDDSKDPFNRGHRPLVYDLARKEWWMAKHERSLRVRGIKGTNHTCLLDQVWETKSPTKGWWQERPPTIDQLYSTSKRAAETYVENGIRRRARIDGLKNWMASNRRNREAANESDYFVNNEWLVEAERLQAVRRENRRLDLWLWNHNKKYNVSSPLDETGLAWFFRNTGVPENADYEHRHYWAIQKLAAWSYSSEQLYDQYHLLENERRSSQNESHYEGYWKNILDEDCLQYWLALNDNFLPRKPIDKPKSIYERKLNAYLMCIDRIEPGNQASIDRIDVVRQQLFVAKTTNYLAFTRHFYQIEPVGEPYGEYDREAKIELIRESNLKHAEKHEKVGEAWLEGISLPNRPKESLKHEDLSRKITDRIFSIEEVKGIIQEEMQDFTVALISEFEAAMEDCVSKVVANAAATLSMARPQAPPATTSSNKHGGYKPNESGIYIPS